MNLPDFVIIGQEDWDEIWRRNQFLISGLAHRFTTSKFLFVELPCDLTYGLRSGELWRSNSTVRRKWSEVLKGVRSCTIAENIILLTLPKFVPYGWPAGLQLYNIIIAKLIRRACSKLRIDKPVLWTQNPLAAGLLPRLQTKAVIYDNTDDWTVAGFDQRSTARIIAGDRYLAQQADLVITCSVVLTEQKKKLGIIPLYLKNGVDYKMYNEGISSSKTATKLSSLTKPVLGYTGSIHSERLDIDLIEQVANRRPEWSFVFIGPSFLSPQDQQRLLQKKNIYLLGARPYTELPSLMYQFDILMLPHLITPFTESLDPIKIYEYLATGKPVVSTPVSGARDYSQYIYLASDAEGFIKQVESGLLEEANLRYERRLLASKQDWEDRISQLLPYLCEFAAD